jgi:hypothetical protein
MVPTLVLAKKNFLIAFCLMFGTTTAIAQHIDWDVKFAPYLNAPLQSLPAKDRQGIVHRLKEKPADLRAISIQTASGHLFFVRGAGDEDCGVDGNCEFWILSDDYRVLLNKIAETFSIRPAMHDGLPDIVTYGHASASEGDLTYWRMQGSRYARVACAGAVYADAGGNTLKRPRITSFRCGTGR